MSRSGYDGDMEDNWAFIMWRGRVASSIRGKRGQKMLQDLEAALLALPDKRLIEYEVANPETGDVCALGALALKRRMDQGKDRIVALKELSDLYPEGCEAEAFSREFDVADPLLKEITFLNDDDYQGASPEERYKAMLSWVQSQIRKCAQ